MVTAIWFLVVLSAVVLVHELGHYIAGRLTKVGIEEFALGFPPRLVSVRRGRTDYSINMIPLGGYVRFVGEDKPDVKDGLASQSRAVRAFVLIAGVTMNIVLAILLFAAVFVIGYPTAIPAEGIRVSAVVPASPAERAGIRADDVLLKLNDEQLDDTLELSAGVRAHLGQEINLLVRHSDGVEETLRLIPRTEWPSNEGPLGVTVGPNYTLETRRYTLPQALGMGLQQTGRATVLTLSVPVMVLRGLIPADLARPVGPVGISRIVGSAAEAIPASGFAPILLTTALISVSLAIVNIMPIPGFDGGRLLFVVLEWLRGGKRINPQREAIIHFTGLMLIMVVFVIITYFDIIAPMPGIDWGP